MTFVIVDLRPDHLAQRIDDYVAVSADVSDWTSVHFLSDLPRKWELSFALFQDDAPIAYCIMSERHGLIHIHQFMVLAAYRRQGIGSQMLGIAMDRGASSLKVSPDNQRAIRFYQQHGWSIHGRENQYYVLHR